jgi:DHA2 family multidrug resistance protein
MSFCRTISGAFATSLVNTEWENQTQVMRANLVGITDPDGSMLASLRHMGMGAAQAVGNLQQMVASQAVMLATNRLFLISGAAFVLAALAIWLAPRPARVADTSQAH